MATSPTRPFADLALKHTPDSFLFGLDHGVPL